MDDIVEIVYNLTSTLNDIPLTSGKLVTFVWSVMVLNASPGGIWDDGDQDESV